MKNTPRVSQDIKRKVYRSITYHLLFQPPPEGFEKAIQFGEEYVNDSTNQPILSGAIWVNLASAYGQKARWLAEHREGNASFEAEYKAVRDKALDAVRKALQLDPNWKVKLTELLVKDQPGKDPEENDLEIFENDKDFRAALGLPPAPPPTDAPPPAAPPNDAPPNDAPPNDRPSTAAPSPPPSDAPSDAPPNASPSDTPPTDAPPEPNS